MNIKFLRGTLAQYNACTKKADNLYFITDTGALYLGEKLIGKDYDNAGFQNATQVESLISAALANYYVKGEIDELFSTLNNGLSVSFGEIADEMSRLEGLITAEAGRAQGVEESLQTQINTIMNNPDTEGVINSINEFTQYIADHGEIAEGFRTDIDKNKEDIAANTQAIANLSEKKVSWNDLTDKPFYETEGRTITFVPTEEAINNGVWINYGLYVRATEEVFSVADMNNAVVEVSTSYGASEYPIITESIADGVVCGRLDDYSITIVSIASAEAAMNAGLGYCEPGTYFTYMDGNYVSALKLAKSVKPLDEKFIPETVVKTEALNNSIGTLKTFLTSQDAVVLAESQAYADQAESDAVAAAKLETQNQVKALEDGQVTTNKNNIANLMVQMTWGDI